ncbi:transposase domain-containing protein [Streptomyces fagopyri]|uniref:transposase domain-containing protein n=1 Tax=Streptomyces fagopyri TaxID=2662397 RepID=UPI003F4D0049
MVDITRTVTVAVGWFAPGQGELTAVVPFELVDAILEETRSVQRRPRDLPSRVGVLPARDVSFPALPLRHDR